MTGSFYSEETPGSTWDFLVDRAIPKIIREGRFQPEFAARCAAEDRAERFVWAGLEGALWDLRVQEQGTSFIECLDAELSPIPSGLAVGIYSAIEDLLDACSRHLNSHYARLKIKIEPGWDIEPVRAIRQAFGNIPLMVDANGSYSETDFRIFEELDDMGLVMIEQPLARDNLKGHVELQARLATPICLDESISSTEGAKRAIESAACRIINLKIQRLGGLISTKEIYDLCLENGVPTWMGTMPELGIGALHALYMSLLPNCVYPTDVEASSRWFVEDIIDPPISVLNGHIEIPPEHRDRPNVSLRIVDRYAVRAKTLLL
jgi:O-succinylbenzoate synthase